MPKSTTMRTIVASFLFVVFGSVNAAVISPGTPTTSVPPPLSSTPLLLYPRLSLRVSTCCPSKSLEPMACRTGVLICFSTPTS